MTVWVTLQGCVHMWAIIQGHNILVGYYSRIKCTCGLLIKDTMFLWATIQWYSVFVGYYSGKQCSWGYYSRVQCSCGLIINDTMYLYTWATIQGCNIPVGYCSNLMLLASGTMFLCAIVPVFLTYSRASYKVSVRVTREHYFSRSQVFVGYWYSPGRLFKLCRLFTWCRFFTRCEPFVESYKLHYFIKTSIKYKCGEKWRSTVVTT